MQRSMQLRALRSETQSITRRERVRLYAMRILSVSDSVHPQCGRLHIMFVDVRMTGVWNGSILLPIFLPLNLFNALNAKMFRKIQTLANLTSKWPVCWILITLPPYSSCHD